MHKMCPKKDCNVWFCPDISGKYKGKYFVIDCQRYGKDTAITSDDVDKLVRDMEHGEYSIGFIVTTEGKLSSAKEKDLKAKKCHFIRLGKTKSKCLRGTNLVENFKTYF